MSTKHPLIKEEYKKYKIWDLESRSDRPDRIIYIYEAIKKLNLPKDFSVVDIACGHGVVANGLIKLFSGSKITITDIRAYSEWLNISNKIKKIEMPLQLFIDSEYGEKMYDVILMLNSYRFMTTKKNGKRGIEGIAREKLDEWILNHCNYFLTSNSLFSSIPFWKNKYEICEISGVDYKNYKLELYRIIK